MELLAFASQDEFEAWMEANHATADGVWIKVAKKGTGIPSVHPPQALDVALCFGWIDGQRGRSTTPTTCRSTRRGGRARSGRRSTSAKVAALIEAGKMRPAGLAEIERAKADGRWDAAYDSPSRISVPPDLQAELDKRPAAAAFFAALKSTNRYAILYRLHDAKRPETRARRLAQFVEMLERGETLH